MHKHVKQRRRKKLVVTCVVLGSVLSTILLPLAFACGFEVIAALVWIWIDEV